MPEGSTRWFRFVTMTPSGPSKPRRPLPGAPSGAGRLGVTPGGVLCSWRREGLSETFPQLTHSWAPLHRHRSLFSTRRVPCLRCPVPSSPHVAQSWSPLALQQSLPAISPGGGRAAPEPRSTQAHSLLLALILVTAEQDQSLGLPPRCLTKGRHPAARRGSAPRTPTEGTRLWKGSSLTSYCIWTPFPGVHRRPRDTRREGHGRTTATLRPETERPARRRGSPTSTWDSAAPRPGGACLWRPSHAHSQCSDTHSCTFRRSKSKFSPGATGRPGTSAVWGADSLPQSH